MFKNIIIGILLATSTMLGFLYETEKHEVADLLEDRLEYSDMLNFQDSLIVKLNSHIDSLDESIYKYSEELAYIEISRNKITRKYRGLVDNINKTSKDSLAGYIVENFEGDTYKLQEINDTSYTALQDTTIKDIVKQHLEGKECQELLAECGKENILKDTIIKQQAKIIEISNVVNSTFEKHNKQLLEENGIKEIKIIKLESEISEQKLWKTGSFILNGILIVVLILI